MGRERNELEVCVWELREGSLCGFGGGGVKRKVGTLGGSFNLMP